MLKSAAALLLAVLAAAAQPIPKKYDPETLKYMQGVIDAIRSENAAFRAEVATLRADVKEIKDTSRRTMQAAQVVQKVNATALSEKALEARVDGLDITIDSGRIAALESKFEADKAERAQRAAEVKEEWNTVIKILILICGGIGSLIAIGFKAWLSGRNLKSDLQQVKVQTNGNLDKVKAERDDALAKLALYKK